MDFPHDFNFSKNLHLVIYGIKKFNWKESSKVLYESFYETNVEEKDFLHDWFQNGLFFWEDLLKIKTEWNKIIFFLNFSIFVSKSLNFSKKKTLFP